MDRYDKILELLENMDDTDKFLIYNEYAAKINDVPLYYMDEFNEIMGNFEPYDIVENVVCCGDFDPFADYFYIDVYGHLRTDINKVYFPEDIADFVDRNNDALQNDDLQDLLRGV